MALPAASINCHNNDARLDADDADEFVAVEGISEIFHLPWRAEIGVPQQLSRLLIRGESVSRPIAVRLGPARQLTRFPWAERKTTRSPPRGLSKRAAHGKTKASPEQVLAFLAAAGIWG